MRFTQTRPQEIKFCKKCSIFGGRSSTLDCKSTTYDVRRRAGSFFFLGTYQFYFIFEKLEVIFCQYLRDVKRHLGQLTIDGDTFDSF